MLREAGITLSCLFGFVAWYYGGNYFISKSTNEATTDKPAPKDSAALPVLTRIDPMKVGHIRDVHIMAGKVHKMRTLSLRPLIFEIEDFLTHEECDVLIELAKTQGMEHSLTVGETPTEEYSEDGNAVHEETSRSSRIKVPPSDPVEAFHNTDVNNDGRLDKFEVNYGLRVLGSVHLNDDDFEKMVFELELDPNNDGFVSYEEFMTMAQANKMDDIILYLDHLKDATPTKRTRNSFSTFLQPEGHKAHEALFQELNSRIQKVSGLPMALISTSEALQVLQYSVKQHYHCHYDTEVEEDRPGSPCCHHELFEEFDECRPCRFMTFFYYLHEPEEGGETAFPIADNATIAPELMNTVESYRCDLSSHCQQANIVYKPKKGAAIFWYNHLVDQESGWLGPRDNMSYHGGCDVIKGTKWAANNWLNAGEDRKKDMAVWKNFEILEAMEALGNLDDWKLEANSETMDGRSDIRQSTEPEPDSQHEENEEAHKHSKDEENIEQEGAQQEQDTN